MDSNSLELAERETKAVLITGRKVVGTQVSDYEHTFQPFVCYLGVMIDAQLNLNHRIYHVNAKASGDRIIQSRLNA